MQLQFKLNIQGEMYSNILWKRSLNNVSYPNIWTEFYQKKTKNSNQMVKYWIQDLPEDRFDEAITHMINYYVPNLPIYACIGML